MAHGLSCSEACGSSRTRDQTRVPCIGRRIPNHCTIREAPEIHFLSEINESFFFPFFTISSVPIFMVRPLKMAVVHPVLDQCLLYQNPTHMTDLSMYLVQAPAGDCSYQRHSEGRAPLLGSLVTNEST